MHVIFRTSGVGIVLAAVALSWLGHAQAGDHARAVASDPTWQTECGSCHVPYPPRLLPASSWQSIMRGLDRHFGTDASVDPNAAREITAFLESHAGRARTSDGTAPLRITETAWFRHEHDEIAAGTWRSAKVKSPANCGACHPAAATGRYSEHDVRVPR